MKIKRLTIFILFALLLSACVDQWAFTVQPTIQDEFTINKKTVEMYSDLKVEDDSSCAGLPLEIALYQQGIEVIDSIEVTSPEGDFKLFNTEDLINDICIGMEGSLIIDDVEIVPETIVVNENDVVLDANNIQDVTATTAYALGLDMEGLNGASLVDQTYEHVVLIFLDGFSYDTYQQALQEDLISNLEDGSIIYKAITVFPPRTTTSSAALLTGLTPNDSGVNKSGIRTTEALTIFDAAAEKGITSIAIEGESLAFNLRNTDAILSGDRDKNGGTDDNTFANALEELNNEVPDLVWIHFHGIDDMGHAYGPVTDGVLDKVVEINQYIGQILEVLPENTLIISFADHGMHYEKEEDEFGNHGNLIYDDMVIPIIIQTR